MMLPIARSVSVPSLKVEQVAEEASRGEWRQQKKWHRQPQAGLAPQPDLGQAGYEQARELGKARGNRRAVEVERGETKADGPGNEPGHRRAASSALWEESAAGEQGGKTADK
jgi:hypothetical protein